MLKKKPSVGCRCKALYTHDGKPAKQMTLVVDGRLDVAVWKGCGQRRGANIQIEAYDMRLYSYAP